MPDLITNVTTDVTSAAVEVTGPCVLHLKGGSTMAPSSVIRIEYAGTDTDADFGPISKDGFFRLIQRNPISIPQTGTYFIRAVTYNFAGSNATIEINQ